MLCSSNYGCFMYVDVSSTKVIVKALAEIGLAKNFRGSFYWTLKNSSCDHFKMTATFLSALWQFLIDACTGHTDVIARCGKFQAQQRTLGNCFFERNKRPTFSIRHSGITKVWKHEMMKEPCSKFHEVSLPRSLRKNWENCPSIRSKNRGT